MAGHEAKSSDGIYTPDLKIAKIECGNKVELPPVTPLIFGGCYDMAI